MNQTRTQKSDAEAGADVPSYTILKFIVIFLGVLLVGGFMFLVGTIVYRVVNYEDEPAAEATEVAAATAETEGTGTVAGILAEIEVLLPAGTSITGHHSLDGDRLSIAVYSADGPRILIVDLKTGKTISTVSLNPE
ncbi:MAG: hypothetical protein V3R73_02285 [Sphingomonadales bacterium]